MTSFSSAEDAEYYGGTILRRLVRLSALAPGSLPPGIQQRAIFWAFTDACAAGIGQRAREILTIVLGPPEARSALATGHIGVKVAPALPDPNRCVRCGHKGGQHQFQTIGAAAHCSACTSNVYHPFEGGYVEAQVPEPEPGV